MTQTYDNRFNVPLYVLDQIHFKLPKIGILLQFIVKVLNHK